jgi:hypothetical protein
MSDCGVHFSGQATDQQGVKGDETGFGSAEATVFMEEKVSRWKESGNLKVLLLRALCHLSIRYPDRAVEGFTPWQVVDEISALRGRPWSDAADKERMSDDVRQYWKQLLEFWETKREGIAQLLGDAGFDHVPHLAKTEGGGTGNPSLYRIEWSGAGKGGCKPEPACESVTDHPKRDLRYVCEDIQEANPFAKIFTRGFLLKGWRRGLYITLLGAPLVFLWLLLVQILFGITATQVVGTKPGSTPWLSFAVMCWATWMTLGPLFELGRKKVVIAPWWMQSVDDDTLLERREPPRFDEKSIKAVRYVASCPICGGNVTATKGGLEFFRRIVGRCEFAPEEVAPVVWTGNPV